jgi:hypothetical protein
MSESKRDRKRRHLASRSALSSRNVVEHAIAECAKVKGRNRSLQSTVLQTNPETLLTVVCIPKQKLQD